MSDDKTHANALDIARIDQTLRVLWGVLTCVAGAVAVCVPMMFSSSADKVHTLAVHDTRIATLETDKGYDMQRLTSLEGQLPAYKSKLYELKSRNAQLETEVQNLKETMEKQDAENKRVIRQLEKMIRSMFDGGSKGRFNEHYPIGTEGQLLPIANSASLSSGPAKKGEIVMDVQQLHDYIIKPVLASMGNKFNSKAARQLLVATAAVESECGRYVRQLGRGPAMGIYQMEGDTLVDLHENYLRFRPRLQEILSDFRMPAGDTLGVTANHAYATALTRLQYWRAEEELPEYGDVDGMWAYYKKHWNSDLGKTTEGKFQMMWALCVDKVDF